ncbi:MAG: helix-turn-helix domain-containing protein [Kiritimatiellae bacterium]|nr:helix-turn-helix domain-containing protein [Kiritimatiellia bacterium]
MQPEASPVAQTLSVLGSVAHLAGIWTVWKNAEGRPESGVSLERALHGSAFCCAVKSRRGGEARCRLEDNVKAATRARRLRRPFTKTCHAGVTELVVPLFYAGCFAGLLFAGPWRKRGARCPYADARAAFGALPVCDGRDVAAVKGILAVLASYLANACEAIRLQRHAASVRDGRIAKALQVIEGHGREPVRAKDVARACGLSTSRFVHLFKDEMSLPFSTYVTRWRVARAKMLLSHTDLRIVDIAAETGFGNQNYFATVFRKAAGLSPGAFRKRNAQPTAP